MSKTGTFEDIAAWAKKLRGVDLVAIVEAQRAELIRYIKAMEPESVMALHDAVIKSLEVIPK
jgi:hypothetical protein